MLRIYPVILEVLKELQPLVRRIELRDKDLARQSRRCSSSIALNVEVCSLVSPGEVTQHPQLNRIIGTLVKLVAA